MPGTMRKGDPYLSYRFKVEITGVQFARSPRSPASRSRSRLTTIARAASTSSFTKWPARRAIPATWFSSMA